MSPTTPHIIVAVPRTALEEDAPLEPTVPTSTPPLALEAYGPAPRATCEAAISNLDREDTVFHVVKLEELPDPHQSELSKRLDERAAERTQAAADLGGFT